MLATIAFYDSFLRVIGTAIAFNCGIKVVNKQCCLEEVTLRLRSRSTKKKKEEKLDVYEVEVVGTHKSTKILLRRVLTWPCGVVGAV